MQDAVRMLLLMGLQNAVNLLVYVICSFDLKAGQSVKFEQAAHGWNGPERTAAARSTIALPAICASSWLSLISMLMTCTGLLYSPPLASRSTTHHQLDAVTCHYTCSPSQTASKQRSSHVITMSATYLLSCHLSGASLSRLFLSSI